MWKWALKDGWEDTQAEINVAHTETSLENWSHWENFSNGQRLEYVYLVKSSWVSILKDNAESSRLDAVYNRN